MEWNRLCFNGLDQLLHVKSIVRRIIRFGYGPMPGTSDARQRRGDRGTSRSDTQLELVAWRVCHLQHSTSDRLLPIFGYHRL